MFGSPVGISTSTQPTPTSTYAYTPKSSHARTSTIARPSTAQQQGSASDLNTPTSCNLLTTPKTSRPNNSGNSSSNTPTPLKKALADMRRSSFMSPPKLDDLADIITKNMMSPSTPSKTLDSSVLGASSSWLSEGLGDETDWLGQTGIGYNTPPGAGRLLKLESGGSGRSSGKENSKKGWLGTLSGPGSPILTGRAAAAVKRSNASKRIAFSPLKVQQQQQQDSDGGATGLLGGNTNNVNSQVRELLAPMVL